MKFLILLFAVISFGVYQVAYDKGHSAGVLAASKRAPVIHYVTPAPVTPKYENPLNRSAYDGRRVIARTPAIRYGYPYVYPQ